MRMNAIRGVRHRQSWRRGERGQAIIMFVGIFTVILVIAAIVIDFGLWFAERRSLQRAADLAAAAGAQDLLFDDNAAFENACGWATKNGFADGIDNVEVSVELLSRNSSATPWEDVCTGDPPPASGACDPLCDSLRVTIKKPADQLFTALPMFNINEFKVGAVAAAGLTAAGGGGGGGGDGDGDVPGGGSGGGASETVILLGAHRSMDRGCPSDCPIEEERQAAHSLVDILVGGTGGQGRVGYAPYNHCYDPPLLTFTYGCVLETIVVDLTNDAGALHAAIDATGARYQASICLPLWRAQRIFAESGSDGGRRSIVFLTSGDNRYHYYFALDQENLPWSECLPAPIPQQPWWISRGCQDEMTPRQQQQEREEDFLTWWLARQLKSDGIEIYVVGIDVCGPDDGHTAADPGYCSFSSIGNEDPDRIADQRLLKCVASSPDHYFSVDLFSEDQPDLADRIQEIASEIVSRGLVQ